MQMCIMRARACRGQKADARIVFFRFTEYTTIDLDKQSYIQPKSIAHHSAKLNASIIALLPLSCRHLSYFGC
jgi:hypothetical protein